MNKHTLDAVRFYEEDGRWYAWMKYTLEDDHEIKEVIIPKVGIGIDRHSYPRFEEEFSLWPIEREGRLGLGGMLFKVYEGIGHDGAKHVMWTSKILKKKTRKMTVADIEKKLGHKIEIVSEE